MSGHKPWSEIARKPNRERTRRDGAALLACAVALVLLLGGCAAMTSNVVQVPVPVPCEIPDVSAPALPIDAVAADADIFTVDRALWASVELLEAYVEQLRALVDACRTKP